MYVPDYVIYGLAIVVVGGSLLALALMWLFRKNKALENRIGLWWNLSFCSVCVVTFAAPAVVGLFIGEIGFKPRMGDAAFATRDGRWPEVYWALIIFNVVVALVF